MLAHVVWRRRVKGNVGRIVDVRKRVHCGGRTCVPACGDAGQMSVWRGMRTTESGRRRVRETRVPVHRGMFPRLFSSIMRKLRCDPRSPNMHSNRYYPYTTYHNMRLQETGIEKQSVQTPPNYPRSCPCNHKRPQCLSNNQNHENGP